MNDHGDLPPMDPQSLAEAAGLAMFTRDRASQALGMELAAIGPGYARMTMLVRPEMLNGHGTCHGGFIFALADSAFAFACNSYNQNTVASGCSIEYLSPGRAGDVLQAEAVEQVRSRKTGVYDIMVTNQDGTCIAVFRGKSFQINGDVIGAAMDKG